MKKHFLVAGTFVLMFAGAFLLTRHEERKDTYQDIRVKMSKDEVRRLLGSPAGAPHRTRRLYWGGTEEIWFGRDGAILVAFNDNNVLTYKEWIEPEGFIYVLGHRQ